MKYLLRFDSKKYINYSLIIQDVHPFDNYTVEDVLRVGPA